MAGFDTKGQRGRREDVKTILLTLLMTCSAYASNNACDLAGKRKICHQCEVNHDKCVKKAGKDKNQVNTCDFNQYICEMVNKCEEDK